MVNAGKMNKRVTIKESVPGDPPKNAYGEPNLVWTSVATVWASVSPLTGREFFAQQQVQSEITVKIKIRYRDDVFSGMQVVYANKIYMVKNVIDTDEYHAELQLMCSEGVRIV